MEMVVAITLLMVAVAGLGLEMGSALSLSRNNRHRSIGANLASREMDLVRSADFNTLPAGRVTAPADVDGTVFTVIRDSEWVAQDTSTGPCDAVAGTRPAFLRVSVFITWPDMAGTKPVESQTVLTPPAGSYDRYTGNIGAKIRDRDGRPAAGHLVTATGPGYTSSQVTTADGCAFFAFVPTGDYAIEVETLGNVDGQGNPAPTKTVTVTVGNTTPAQFDYDRASIVALTLVGKEGGTVPSSVPVTLANGALLPDKLKVFGGSGSPRSMANLYPYNNGYEYFAGSCADADPEGQDPGGTGPLYPGAARPEALSVTPGATVTGTLELPSVDVQVLRLGVPVVGATVTAVHAADSICGSGESLGAGLTGVDGKLRVSLPYGKWSFSAQVGPDSGTSSVDTELRPDTALVQDATVVIP